MLSLFSHVRLCVTPEMAAYQAPLSTGFSRQEYWNGLLCPSPPIVPRNLSSIWLVSQLQMYQPEASNGLEDPIPESHVQKT